MTLPQKLSSWRCYVSQPFVLGLRNNIWLRVWKTLFITTEHLYGVTPVTFTVLRSPVLAHLYRMHDLTN
ncbi:hypothetical protein SPC668_04720 [Salmonella enterica subsp. enterica serovar Paratyphi C]|nr:hypothetical protein SPC668_04720 [Salmonella enterica subsp. enterica serovar Paratyphi C]